MSTGNPESPSPAADGSAAAGAKKGPGGKFIAISGVIAVALGVVGFFIGSSVKESDYKEGKPAYEKIYQAGYRDGQSAGTAAGQKAGQAKGLKLGTAQGLQVGRKAGEVIGKNAGIKEGQQVGYKQGYAAGFASGVTKGALAAFGGLTNWSNDIPYVVELDPSPVTGVSQQVYSRTEMKANTSYFLCPDGRSACSSPLLK